MNKMKIIAVIPARYESSRFPGKPLADINGKLMIELVYHQVLKVKEISEVFVATDDDRIMNACKERGVQAIMTSKEHRTGTDRLGEVASRIPADVYVNVQGDEPMIEPDNIRTVIEPFLEGKKVDVTNLMSKITNPIELHNPTVVKVVTNNECVGVFLSRSPIPFPKGSIEYDYFKQLGVYAFTKEALLFFSEYGKKHGKAKIESVEDVEILRFIENGYKVIYRAVESSSLSVDTQKDLEKVRNIMKLQK